MSLASRIIKICQDTCAPLIQDITTIRNNQATGGNDAIGKITKFNSSTGLITVKRPDQTSVDCTTISNRPLGIGTSVLLAANIITD